MCCVHYTTLTRTTETTENIYPIIIYCKKESSPGVQTKGRPDEKRLGKQEEGGGGSFC